MELSLKQSLVLLVLIYSIISGVISRKPFDEIRNRTFGASASLYIALDFLGL